MATLKICGKYPEWVTEVDEIAVVRQFEVENDIWRDAELNEYEMQMARTPSVDWGECKVGVVAYVSKQGKPGDKPCDIWLLPANRCFIMSDSGKTIDRF